MDLWEWASNRAWCSRDEALASFAYILYPTTRALCACALTTGTRTENACMQYLVEVLAPASSFARDLVVPGSLSAHKLVTGHAHMLMDHGRSAAASFCPSNDLRCMSLIDKNRRYGTEWVGRCFGGVCWNASLVNPRGSGARGPSAEVWHGTWGEAKYLLPIFNTVLGGTCMQPDGSRKVVVDGARRRLVERRCRRRIPPVFSQDHRSGFARLIACLP